MDVKNVMKSNHQYIIPSGRIVGIIDYVPAISIFDAISFRSDDSLNQKLVLLLVQGVRYFEVHMFNKG